MTEPRQYNRCTPGRAPPQAHNRAVRPPHERPGQEPVAGTPRQTPHRCKGSARNGTRQDRTRRSNIVMSIRTVRDFSVHGVGSKIQVTRPDHNPTLDAGAGNRVIVAQGLEHTRLERTVNADRSIQAVLEPNSKRPRCHWTDVTHMPVHLTPSISQGEQSCSVSAFVRKASSFAPTHRDANRPKGLSPCFRLAHYGAHPVPRRSQHHMVAGPRGISRSAHSMTIRIALRGSSPSMTSRL